MDNIERPQQVADKDDHSGMRTTASNYTLATRKVRIHFQSSCHNQPSFLIAPVLQSLLIFYIGNNKRGQWTMTRDVFGQAIR
jgi:hypothetical protein